MVLYCSVHLGAPPQTPPSALGRQGVELKKHQLHPLPRACPELFKRQGFGFAPVLARSLPSVGLRPPGWPLTLAHLLPGRRFSQPARLTLELPRSRRCNHALQPVPPSGPHQGRADHQRRQQLREHGLLPWHRALRARAHRPDLQLAVQRVFGRFHRRRPLRKNHKRKSLSRLGKLGDIQL